MAKSKLRIESVTPFASLSLTGKDLDPQKITDEFGVNPTKSFKRGEKRQNGEKDRSHGLWQLSSDEVIETIDPVLHIKWLIDQIEPAKKKLLTISKDDSIHARIKCFWVMPSSHEYLIIEPELQQRIAELNIRFELVVLSPDY